MSQPRTRARSIAQTKVRRDSRVRRESRARRESTAGRVRSQTATGRIRRESTIGRVRRGSRVRQGSIVSLDICKSLKEDAPINWNLLIFRPYRWCRDYKEIMNALGDKFDKETCKDIVSMMPPRWHQIVWYHNHSNTATIFQQRKGFKLAMNEDGVEIMEVYDLSKIRKNICGPKFVQTDEKGNSEDIQIFDGIAMRCMGRKIGVPMERKHVLENCSMEQIEYVRKILSSRMDISVFNDRPLWNKDQ